MYSSASRSFRTLASSTARPTDVSQPMRIVHCRSRPNAASSVGRDGGNTSASSGSSNASAGCKGIALARRKSSPTCDGSASSPRSAPRSPAGGPRRAGRGSLAGLQSVSRGPPLPGAVRAIGKTRPPPAFERRGRAPLRPTSSDRTRSCARRRRSPRRRATRRGGDVFQGCVAGLQERITSSRILSAMRGRRNGSVRRPR
jgi:hypothetical protein